MSLFTYFSPASTAPWSTKAKFHVVAVALEDGHQQLEVERRHLRREDGVALFLHLLGELRPVELGGRALALLDLRGARHAVGLLRERFRHQRVDVVDVDGHGGHPALAAASSRASSASRSDWSFRAASRLRIRMRAAPRFDTSSMFSVVYTFPAASSTSCTWSTVSASSPQPNEFSCTRSKSDRCVHTLAAAYRRVWYIHWSTTRMASKLPQVCNGVLGQHGKPEAGQKLGDGVVDFGVLVVGAAGQHDSARAGLLHPCQRLHALASHVALERLVLFPGGVDRVVYLLLRDGVLGAPPPRRGRCRSARNRAASSASPCRRREATGKRRPPASSAARRCSGAAPRDSWPRWGS